MSFGSWVSYRVGGLDGWRALLDPPRGPANWGRPLAIAAIVSALVAAASGVGLAFTYAPSVASAWASVFSTEYVLHGGWLVRSIHVAAAESTIVVGTLALLVTTVEGRYRGLRDLAFYCLALLVAMAFAFAITGNPLRWDNRGYFGFQTEMNIAGELPGGGIIRSLALGGSTLGNWTLARLYALHALVLPLVVAVVLAIWARVSMRAAEEVPEAVVDQRDAQSTRDVAVTAVVLVAMAIVAVVHRAPLEAPADPVAAYNARPEWYFLALYVVRNAVPAKMQAIVAGSVPVFLAAVIVALPRLDRDPTKSLKERMLYVGPMAVAVIGGLVLTLFGVRHDATDAGLLKSHAAQEKIDRRAIQVALSTGVPPSGALTMMREDPVLHAQDLFREHCAQCHQLGDMAPRDGKLTAPSLDGWGTEAWAHKVMDDPDASDLFGPTGYKEKMPSVTKPPKDPQRAKDWKAPKPEEVDAMARWLAHEAEGQPKGHDADGEKLVSRRCTGCHLLHGESDDENGAAPELARWGSLAWLRQQIAAPDTGATYRPAASQVDGHMPRFDEKLSASEIDLVARFVWQRARQATAKK